MCVCVCYILVDGRYADERMRGRDDARQLVEALGDLGVAKVVNLAIRVHDVAIDFGQEETLETQLAELHERIVALQPNGVVVLAQRVHALAKQVELLVDGDQLAELARERAQLALALLGLQERVRHHRGQVMRAQLLAPLGTLQQLLDETQRAEQALLRARQVAHVGDALDVVLAESAQQLVALLLAEHGHAAHRLVQQRLLLLVLHADRVVQLRFQVHDQVVFAPVSIVTQRHEVVCAAVGPAEDDAELLFGVDERLALLEVLGVEGGQVGRPLHVSARVLHAV